MLRVETEQEDSGRWLAGIPDIPGAMAYGSSEGEAIVSAEALALRALAERLEHGEPAPDLKGLFAA